MSKTWILGVPPLGSNLNQNDSRYCTPSPIRMLLEQLLSPNLIYWLGVKSVRGSLWKVWPALTPTSPSFPYLSLWEWEVNLNIGSFFVWEVGVKTITLRWRPLLRVALAEAFWSHVSCPFFTQWWFNTVVISLVTYCVIWDQPWASQKQPKNCGVEWRFWIVLVLVWRTFTSEVWSFEGDAHVTIHNHHKEKRIVFIIQKTENEVERGRRCCSSGDKRAWDDADIFHNLYWKCKTLGLLLKIIHLS